MTQSKIYDSRARMIVFLIPLIVNFKAVNDSPRIDSGQPLLHYALPCSHPYTYIHTHIHTAYFHFSRPFYSILLLMFIFVNELAFPSNPLSCLVNTKRQLFQILATHL